MAVDIDYTLTAKELDMLQELLPEFYNCMSIGPRFRELDWENEFRKDMLIGKGFIVKAKPFKKKIKDKDGNIINKGIKEMDGTHSPRFGSDWQDDNAFAERYSCQCHNLIGKLFLGRRCKKCGTKVKFVDVDLKIFAWLKITSPFYLIQPLMYKKLDSFFGKNVLNNIINFQKKMTLDGYYTQPDDVDLDKNPFYGIGMIEFHDRFDEILDYYKKKKKNKAAMYYSNIMENREKIFTTSVPIYSAVLRQVFFTDEDYSYTKIDKDFNAMYGNICKINEEPEVNSRNLAKINKNLYKAQNNLNDAFELIFTSINEKEGLIRRNILGGRVNFSARNVIIPDPTLRSYQIRLPYVCFIELYKEEIINLLVKLTGVSYNMAVEEWFNAYREFDAKVYSVMEYILEHTKRGCRCLLNRNPTINFGSFLCMQVVSVKKDYDDLSCSLPIGCLSSMNADFDGDVVNIESLKTEELKKEFNKVMNPHNGFLIDRNSGLFNTDFSLIKDQLICLHQFCTI